jgi:hypothetical protein
MDRRKFLSTLGLTGCLTGCAIHEEPREMSREIFHALMGFGGSGVDLNNSVFLIFDIGQSNSIGRAESDRLRLLTQYTVVPNSVKVFYKPSYTITNDGTFVPLENGSIYTKEPDQSASFRFFGAYSILADKLSSISPNTVYVCPVGDGGTSLAPNIGGTRDWDPASSNECFDTAFEYYYPFAYSKIEAEQPGKTIIPIMLWHQGENDAADATATANYGTNFAAFMIAARASHVSLANAYLIITKLYYNIDANEATINSALQSYADSNSTVVSILDISSQPRKQDLTVGQKGGVTPTASDDQHTSYLGQIYKGEQFYSLVKTRLFAAATDSEITNNTGFDPSTILSTGIRLQFSSSKVTYSSQYALTAITNDLSTGSFTNIQGTLKPIFKVIQRKGAVEYLSSGSAWVESSAAIGTALFAGGYYFGEFIKPLDGQPALSYTIYHDIANIADPNQTRTTATIQPNGKIYGYIAVGGTVKQFQTASAIFTNGAQLNEVHLAITFTNGDYVRVYIDGVLQTLDAALDSGGSLSGINLSSYANSTNPLHIAVNRAAVRNLFFFGTMREFTIQNTVWSQANIDNLMLN